MADIANGTQFSDLPSYLAIDILLRLPLKALLICRYVRKDWTCLYFSDPYFISRQLETSNIQFLDKDITSERKFQFGCIVDEVSTGNLRMETLDFSCKLLQDPKYNFSVVNSCNGLVCLIDKSYVSGASSSVYVCNPILGEWVSVPVPSRCYCALGFSAKNNQYKILLSFAIEEDNASKYEWEIYTLGTKHWRNIKTKEDIEPGGLCFNTFIYGSLHWTNAIGRLKRVHAFDFETERLTTFSLPKFESPWIEGFDVMLGVINDCLWASFCNRYSNQVQMWVMKEYGVHKSWTMMLALRDDDRVYDPPDEVLKARYKELVIYKDHIRFYDLLFSLNGELMLTSVYGNVTCYNIKTPRRRALTDQSIGRITAFNPSFVSVHDFGRGEQDIRDPYDGWLKKRVKKKSKEKQKKNTKKKLKKETKKKLKRVWL